MDRFVFSLWMFVSLLGGCISSSPLDVNRPELETGINGQVRNRDGKAVVGAWIYVYRNTSTSLRGPADFGARTDLEGHYFIDLVEGRYYLVARWRRDGGEAGPPQVGDAWALPQDNPLEVETGRIRRADFVLQGVTAGQPVILRSGSLGREKSGFTGRLADADGSPLPGAFALAYRDADFRRMPDYTSAVVGSDGRFFLYVPAGGRYCLAARTRTRGQPVAGEPYGALGDGNIKCPTAVENRLIDVGIIRLKPYQR